MKHYKVGDLVWAKMKGFSPWPGRVSNPTEDLKKVESKNSDLCCIFFFGTNNYAWIKESNIKPYFTFKEQFVKAYKSKAFGEAVKAIEHYIKNYIGVQAVFENHAIVENKMSDVPCLKLLIPKQETETELDLKLVSTIKTEIQDSENLETGSSSFEFGNQSVNKEELDEDIDDDSHPCDSQAYQYDFKNITKETICIENKNVKVENLYHKYELSTVKTDQVNEVTKDIVPLWEPSGINNIKVDTKDRPCKNIDKANVPDAESNISDDNDDVYDICCDEKEKDLQKVNFPGGNWNYCAVCGLRFTRKQLLETHITSHSEEMFIIHTEDLELFLTKNNILNNVKKQFDTKNFICNLCCKQFHTKDKFLVHLLFHINNENVICHVCNISYSKTDWFSHLQTHGTEKYICNICGIRLLAKYELYNHLKLHTDEQYLTRFDNLHSFFQNSFSKEVLRKLDVENLFCKVCNKTFSRESLFFSHVIRCIDNNKHVCEICQRSFTSERFLSLHLLTHDTGGKYTCYICNKKFVIKASLSRHLASQLCIFEHNCKILNMSYLDEQALLSKCHICFKSQLSFDAIKNIKSKFICHICKKIFKLKFVLQAHLFSHSEVRNYVCDVCNKSFKTRGNIREHFKIHFSEREHVCNTCGKSFKTKVELSRHSFCHSDTKSFICTVCNKSFQRKGYLIKHSETHSDTRKYTCTICAKSFKRRVDLKNHLKTHLNCNKIKKSYTCDVCGRSISTLRNLSAHLAAHNNSYVCHVCNKTFTYKSYLKSHLLIHNDIKSFSCHICKKLFTCKSYLQSHLLLHNDVKSYSCYICKKLFTCKSYLQSHLLLHNEVKSFSCHICKKLFKIKKYLARHLKQTHFK